MLNSAVAGGGGLTPVLAMHTTSPPMIRSYILSIVIAVISMVAMPIPNLPF